MLRNLAIFATALLAAGMVAAPIHAQPRHSETTTTAPSRASLTNSGVLKLVKAGLPADVVIAKIQQSACDFDTSPAALAHLKKAGVPDNVILAMVKAPVAKDPAANASAARSPVPETRPAKSTERRSKAEPGLAPHGRNLWIARFMGQTKALTAIASVQHGDLATLEQSNLFGKVSSYTTVTEQPVGTWALSGKETSFSKGSAAKRVMLGFGSGRAHIVMEYKLRNPIGKVVWSKKIKTEPSFWASGGAVGGIQNQNAAFGKQPQKLLEALSKFFASK